MNEEENNYSNEEQEYENIEKKKNLVKLKMFNIVIILEKTSPLLKNIRIIYEVLESFSQYLAFEEYRSAFLGHEILNLFRLFEKFSKDSTEVSEDVSFYINKYFYDLTNKNRYQEKEKENILYLYGNSFKDKDNKDRDARGFFLVKNIQKFYDDLKSFQFFKIPINNWFEFKAPTKLLNYSNDIRNYHTLLITKRKQVNEWMLHSYDLNPLVPIFLEVVTPFKNFQEISLEYKIPMDFIKFISKQVHCLNFGKIVTKFNNHTILTVNPNLKIKPKLDYDFQKLYNLNLYETLNNFLFNNNLNKIFKKNFSAFTNEKFLNLVEYLTINECLIQCSKYILTRNPFSRIYNKDLILLNKSQILFHKPEKLETILNDFDANCSNRAIKLNNSNSNKISEPNFEDILLKFKSINIKDYEILINIYYLLSPDFEFDEICFLTGYKHEVLLNLFKTHKFLFNIIISDE